MIYHNGGDDFQGLELAVRQTTAALRPHRADFDSIVVTGVSGQCVGFPVALRLRKPIVVLRKKTDPTHGGPGALLNRRSMGTRVVFVDDFVADGNTLKLCQTAVERHGGTIAYVYLYRDGELAWSPGTVSADFGSSVAF